MPALGAAPLRLTLRAWLTGPAASDLGAAERLRAGLAVAAAAAAKHAAGPGARANAGTGEVLRANFLLLCDAVAAADGHLLAEEELCFTAAFRVLPAATQCLFLRLHPRRGPWFRLGSLAYSEVGDAAEAARALADAKLARLLERAGAADVEAAVNVLTAPELAALAARLRLLPAGRTSGNSRPQLLAAIAGALHADPPATGRLRGAKVREELVRAVGPCVRLTPSAAAAARRLQRIFFLHEGHDLSRFLVTDLGTACYPRYRVWRTRPVWRTREALLAYEAALEHAALLDAALEAGNVAAAEAALQPAWAALYAGEHKVPPTPPRPPLTTYPAAPSPLASGAGRGAWPAAPFLRRFSAAWVHVSMATAGVALREKQRRYAEAADLLRLLLGGECCYNRRGEWWVRLSIDTEHLGRPEEALEVAEAALADEHICGGERLDLQRRILRLGKPPRRWRKPAWASTLPRDPPEVRIEGRPIASVLGAKSQFWSADGSAVGVEQLALLHYATEAAGGWRGMHCEGGVWATLFGLLLWPALFAAVPDALRSSFQTSPLDLSTPGFYLNRQAIIEARLAEVAAGAAPALLREAWAAHHGVMCVGVNWERQGVEELVEIADCVGGSSLAGVMRLLAQDHAGWAGGMPDLLLWKRGESTEDLGSARLAEVKGPRDALSQQQRAWLAALASAGLHVEVLKVVEPGTAVRKHRRR
ncbi:hypothetical protein WJX81_006116 [Elliptochloris bilobata]|uniref:Fanconi-associated nuclease n=1 Tax=Elliptochloris bilobata TaxID=381761 RepID=A0AAW1QDY4_9CHLO